nr:Co2+/Mg2+ efflux protein ApaG [uncultured Flavobacterium sp.]
MVSKITNGIKVIVSTSYEGTYFKDHVLQYAFAYQITIENHSNDTVQLLTRHWQIQDSLNDKEFVSGEGVLGQKPVIKSGGSFSYESFCLLKSPFGAMKGFFNMINYTTTKSFDIIIPTFKLSAPFAIN